MKKIEDPIKETCIVFRDLESERKNFLRILDNYCRT